MIETTQKMSNLRPNSNFREWVLTMEMNLKGKKEVMETNMKAIMNEVIADVVLAPYRNRNIEGKAAVQSTTMAMIEIDWRAATDAVMPWILSRTKSRPRTLVSIEDLLDGNFVQDNIRLSGKTK